MRRPPWLLLLGLLVGMDASRLAAQERQLGVKVGASLSTLHRDRPTSELPYDHRPGITGGAYLVQPVRERIALQVEMLFTEKGASLPFNPPSLIQGEMSIRYKFHYMDVPILARVGGPRVAGGRLHVFAGPTVSLRLSARQQTVFLLGGAAGFERDVGSEMDRMDFGMTVGAALDISRMALDVRYTHGFNDVLGDLAGARVGNRNVLITAGVRFF